MSELNAEYWNKRYLNSETGWDIGRVSGPLQAYVDQIEKRDIHVLIPGCGNAYEAEYLLAKGFGQITLIDISENLTQKLEHKFKEHSNVRVICADFFEHRGQYDLILEQTFFCAIDRKLRPEYASAIYSLLKPQGVLAGVLFASEFEREGPPFGGTEKEYREIFAKHFRNINIMPCLTSIPARMGNELFIQISNT